MFVDINVLVYAAIPAAPLHGRARDALAKGAAEPPCHSRPGGRPLSGEKRHVQTFP